MRWTTRAVLISAGLLVAWPRVARADSATDNAAADALFRSARKLFVEKKYDQACPKFQQSLALSKRLGTLLNLATCHEREGKTASAWTEFNQAIALARQEHSARRERYAEHHAHALAAELSRITLNVPKDLTDASLTLDGNKIGSGAWGTPLPVDPGTHQVEVEAPGRKPWSKQVTISAHGGTIQLQIPELETQTAAPAAPAPTPAKTPRSAPAHDQNPPAEASNIGHTFGWVALGIGAVGVGVGSYFGLRTFSSKSDANKHCGSAIGQSNSQLCDQQGVDLRNQAKTDATLSTISFAVGAAGVAAGVVLLLTGGAKSKSHAARLNVEPVLGRNAGMMLLTGTL